MGRRPGLPFEDLRVGDRYGGPHHVMTEEEIIRFARLFDPQPMHTDPVAARSGPFGRLTASGRHTLAVESRLHQEARQYAFVAGLGFDLIRFPAPVFPGDALSFGGEIVALRTSRSHPGTGIVTFATELTNQTGEIVLRTEGVSPRPADVTIHTPTSSENRHGIGASSRLHGTQFRSRTRGARDRGASCRRGARPYCHTDHSFPTEGRERRHRPGRAREAR